VAETEGRALTDRNTGRRPAIPLGHALGLSAGSRKKQRIGRRQLGRSESGQETVELDRGLCGNGRSRRRGVERRAGDQDAQKTEDANSKLSHERDPPESGWWLSDGFRLALVICRLKPYRRAHRSQTPQALNRRYRRC